MSYEPKCEPTAYQWPHPHNMECGLMLTYEPSAKAEWCKALYTKADLATEVQAAIEAERERCAKLVEGNHILAGGNGPNFNAGWEVAIEASASAIRRGPALQSMQQV